MIFTLVNVTGKFSLWMPDRVQRRQFNIKHLQYVLTEWIIVHATIIATPNEMYFHILAICTLGRKSVSPIVSSSCFRGWLFLIWSNTAKESNRVLKFIGNACVCLYEERPSCRYGVETMCWRSLKRDQSERCRSFYRRDSGISSSKLRKACFGPPPP